MHICVSNPYNVSIIYASDGKLSMGPKSKAGIIQQKFLEHSHTENGMQSCYASTDIKLKSNQLMKHICGQVLRLLLKYYIYCTSAPSLYRVSTYSGIMSLMLS